MGAILYLRVSTDEQADSGLGLAAQERAVRTAAAKHGGVRAVYRDEGVSGSTVISARPGLFAALAAVRRGDVLMVAKRDRIARDQLITLTVERELQKKGARLISASGEGSEGTDIGSLIQRRMLDLFAEVEREMIRSRTRAALAEKKDRGERISHQIPYGYSLADDGVHLLPNHAEQLILDEVWSLADAGYSVRAIAQVLNDRGIPTRCGGRWHKTTIHNIVQRRSRSGAH